MAFVGAALPLNRDGLTVAAGHVDVDPIALWSVVVVETSGCGFLPDRRPDILFERHIFSTRTGRRFDASHPEISGRAGGYGRPGAHQYERLAEAIACDRRAALESASWGLGQVMGFNATSAGFRDAEHMVAQMMHSENEQILGMVRFMRTTGMHAALQRRDWTAFARRYNGPGFAQNRYDEKLAATHSSLSSGGLPDLDVRAVQLLLTYHGFNPGPIDGAPGKRTRAAIAAFTARHKLSAISANHRELLAALRELLPTVPNEQLSVSPSTPESVPAASDLRLVQSTLAFLRFDPGTVDGKPGPRTRSAIRDFQGSCGAMATGEVDAGLVASLKAETRRAFGHNRIADIRLVQQLLRARGFDPGGIDGLAGPRTKAAIAAFQQAQGTPSTDEVDVTLLDALLANN
jgi:peptidoglycan hydrolase-like protein with peptidoglycan-binding domain